MRWGFLGYLEEVPMEVTATCRRVAFLAFKLWGSCLSCDHELLKYGLSAHPWMIEMWSFCPALIYLSELSQLQGSVLWLPGALSFGVVPSGVAVTFPGLLSPSLPPTGPRRLTSVLCPAQRIYSQSFPLRSKLCSSQATLGISEFLSYIHRMILADLCHFSLIDFII